jgi:hypothetical protein
MTNPTSNFGWQMPTPTDLVTDLPADFEVFGQAVDTSMADLLGGTTGQILAKASNSNMDFAWITNDVGDITAVNVTSPITGGGSSGAVTIGINAATTSVVGAVQLSDSTSTTSSVLASTPTATKSAYDLADAAIAKSTVTTAGDIIYRNATVPVRLGIGTANQVLRVNSGATAPEWATISTASGLTYITSQTASDVASLTFDSVFTSTYTNYLIVYNGVRSTTANPDADLYLQLRYAGPTTQAATYQYGLSGTNTASAAINVGATNQSQMILSRNLGNSSYFINGQLFIQNAGVSGNTTGTGQNTDAYGEEFLNYGFIQTTVRTYTGFLISSSLGRINGTFTLYGLAKS